MGMVKGIQKLSTFIKRSGTFDKDNNYMTHKRERNKRERGRGRGEVNNT